MKAGQSNFLLLSNKEEFTQSSYLQSNDLIDKLTLMNSISYQQNGSLASQGRRQQNFSACNSRNASPSYNIFNQQPNNKEKVYNTHHHENANKGMKTQPKQNVDSSKHFMNYSQTKNQKYQNPISLQNQKQNQLNSRNVKYEQLFQKLKSNERQTQQQIKEWNLQHQLQISNPISFSVNQTPQNINSLFTKNKQDFGIKQNETNQPNSVNHATNHTDFRKQLEKNLQKIQELEQDSFNSSFTKSQLFQTHESINKTNLDINSQNHPSGYKQKKEQVQKLIDTYADSNIKAINIAISNFQQKKSNGIQQSEFDAKRLKISLKDQENLNNQSEFRPVIKQTRTYDIDAFQNSSNNQSEFSQLTFNSNSGKNNNFFQSKQNEVQTGLLKPKTQGNTSNDTECLSFSQYQKENQTNSYQFSNQISESYNNFNNEKSKAAYNIQGQTEIYTKKTLGDSNQGQKVFLNTHQEAKVQNFPNNTNLGSSLQQRFSMPTSPINGSTVTQNSKITSNQINQKMEQQYLKENQTIDQNFSTEKPKAGSYKYGRSSSQEIFMEEEYEQTELFKKLNKATQDLKKKLELYTQQNQKMKKFQQQQQKVLSNNQKQQIQNFKNYGQSSQIIQTYQNSQKTSNNILQQKQLYQIPNERVKQYDAMNYQQKNYKKEEISSIHKNNQNSASKNTIKEPLLNEFHIEELNNFNMVLTSENSHVSSQSLIQVQDSIRNGQNEDIDLDFTPRFFFKKQGFYNSQSANKPKIPLLNLHSLKANRRK